MDPEDIDANPLEDSTFDFLVDSLLVDEFSFEAAYSLAHASLLVYDDETKGVISQIGARGLGVADLGEVENPFSIGPTQGFVVETDHRLILVFRGTKGKDDWKVNLHAKPRHVWFSVPGKIHTGFWKALQQVWEPVVEPLVAASEKSGKKIVIAGHSLGGAIATLAAARIAKHINPDLIASVYTFGQPRVGDAKFVKYMEQTFGSSFTRFVNNCDIVPMIPPGPLYQHPGKLYHFDANGDLKGSESKNEPSLSPEEFKKFVEFVKENSPPEAARKGIEFKASQRGNVKDHSMDTGYIPALKKLTNSDDGDETLASQ